jgi:hypothetical protein
MAVQHARINNEALRKAVEAAFDGVWHPKSSSALDTSARLIRTSDAIHAEVRAMLHDRIVNLLADAAATTRANRYEIADPPPTWVNPVQPT